jgi:hypothetical protein
MRLSWGVHMEAHLLDDIGDVRPGEGEVLEHVGQAPIRRRIDDRGAVVLRELCLSEVSDLASTKPMEAK